MVSQLKAKWSLILFSFLGLIVLFLLINPVSTIFSVSGRTECLEIRITEQSKINPFFEDFLVIDNEDRIVAEHFFGRLEPSAGTQIFFERQSYGALWVTVKGQNNESPGRLVFEGEDRKTRMIEMQGTYLFFADSLQERAQRGLTQLFVLDGEVSLGRTVGQRGEEQPTSMLLKAELLMTGEPLVGDRYPSGSAQLAMGDQLTFTEIEGNSYGALVLNEEPAMHVAYRVLAKTAEIAKPGPFVSGKATSYSAGKLDQFLNATFYQYISLFFAIIAIFTSIGSFMLDYLSFDPEIKSISPIDAAKPPLISPVSKKIETQASAPATSSTPK